MRNKTRGGAPENKEARDEDVDVKQRGANSVVRFCIPADELGKDIVFESDPTLNATPGVEDLTSGADAPENYDEETGGFKDTDGAVQARSSMLVGVMSLFVILKFIF